MHETVLPSLSEPAFRFNAGERSKEAWRKVTFGEVARCVNESETNPQSKGLERIVGLEHIDPEDLRIKRWTSIEEGTSFTRVFRAGQVLFGKRRAYQRKVALADFDGICSGDILVFEARPDVLLPELLPFLVQTEGFFQHALGTSAGSLSPRTKWSDLANYEFLLPPMEHQRRIANILWALEESIGLYRRSLEALFQFKQAWWLSRVENQQWPIILIGQVAEVSNGTTPRRSIERYWNTGTIPWLPSQKINDRIIHSADEFVTQSALKECSLKILPAGSTLIAMIGEGQTRGHAAFLMTDACINQNLACVTPKEELDAQFLFFSLEQSYDRLRNFSQGSNQSALNCGLLRTFPLPHPPIEVQRMISGIMLNIENMHQQVVLYLKTVSKLQGLLLCHLLSKPHEIT